MLSNAVVPGRLPLTTKLFIPSILFFKKNFEFWDNLIAIPSFLEDSHEPR